MKFVNQILVFVIIGLMLNLPIVMAASDYIESMQAHADEAYEQSRQDYYDEVYNQGRTTAYDEYLSGIGAQNLGEAIIINVGGYEPSPIPQSSIENGNVPVYIYLKGTTLGTLATYITGQSQEDIATGISNIPPIKTIDITPDEASKEFLSSFPKYIQPIQGRLSLNNLGMIVATIKQVKNEKLVPQNIDLNFTAKIYFDLESGGSLFGLSQENLILNLQSNEQAWLNVPDYQKGRAFADRVFIRAVQVRGTTADFEIYDKNYNIIPASIESVSPGFAGTNLNTNEIIPVEEGNERTIQIGNSGDLFMDSFVLKLNKIIEPADKVQLKLSVNGKDYQRTLVAGSLLYPTSKWSLDSISQDPAMPKPPKEMPQAEFIEYLNKNNIKIVKGAELSQEQLKEVIPQTVYFRENKIVLTNGYDRYELKSIQATKDAEGKKGIFDIRPLKPEEVSVLESLYCPRHVVSSAACESVNSFKEMIEKYPSNNLLPKAYFDLGHIYGDQLINPTRIISNIDEVRYVTDMNNLAYYYYNKVLEFESDKKQEAMDKLEMLTTTFTAEAFLDDENVYLQVLRVIPLVQQDTGTATIKNIPGSSRDYKIGDTIDNTESNYNGNKFYWKVKEIKTNKVTLVRTDDETMQYTLYINSEISLPKGNCEDVYIEGTRSSTIMKCDKEERIKLENTQVPVELDVTVTPGTGKAYSISNFQVHLLIDKRPFELTPDQLKDQIKKTQELIKKLDKTITKLDKIVREWKKTCLVTSTYLMIKNSFLTGNARNEARKTVMPIYGEQCKEEMGNLGYTTSASKYRSLSGCYTQKAAEIEKTLDAAEASIKKTDERFKQIKKPDSADPLAADYKKFISAGGTDEDFKNYLRYSELQKASNLDPKIKAKFGEKINTIGFEQKIGLYDNANNFAMEQFDLAGRSYDSFNAEQKKKYEDYFNVALASYANPVQSAAGSVESIPLTAVSSEELPTNNAERSSGILFASGAAVFVELVGTKQVDTKLKLYRPTRYAYELYTTKDSSGLRCITKQNNNEKENCLLNYKYEQKTGTQQMAGIIVGLKDSGAIDSNGKAIFIDVNDLDNFKAGAEIKFYSSTTQDFTEGIQIRKSYAQQKTITAQFTLDGYPYCYPIGDIGGLKVGDALIGAGDYALVLDWYKVGSPKEMQIWNVGADGKIDCGRGDDQLIASQDALKQKENEKAKNRIDQIVRGKQCTKDGQIMGQISASGSSLKVSCSTNEAKDTQQLSQPQCTDLMDPSDCKLLFNVCDPVMCPTSRCNLGGRWHVDNVIGSGLIGSIILCLPNRQDGVVVPVCLTGILAGLKNIKTILQGYESCLQTSLENHENVGMCDYIKSIGICELAWKEAMFIIGAKGGIMDWALEKISPNKGGGEYLNFRQNFEQLSKSFNYFTTEYSESLLAQYKSKSTEEIGSEVCRMAIAGKFPNFGELLNEMSEPEEPPQFMAVFDESPSITQAGIDEYGRQSEGRSLYRGFYHIYAGKAYAGTYLAQPERSNIIQYSVYLRNSRNQQQTVLYVTKNNGKLSRAANLQRGMFAQESINVYGAEDYDQICVVIDGKTYCGFGKTSSAFSVGALQDQLVMDEISRQNIQTAADCNPSYSRTSPSLDSITMPQQFGILNSGIVRICNPVNPGTEDRWTVIGDCGNDKNGKYLGKCWLDKNSISINDAVYAGQVAEDIEQKAREINGVTGPTLPSNVAVPALTDLNRQREELIEQMKKESSPEPNNPIQARSQTPGGETKFERLTTLGIGLGGPHANFVSLDKNIFSVSLNSKTFVFAHEDQIRITGNQNKIYIGFNQDGICKYLNAIHINKIPESGGGYIYNQNIGTKKCKDITLDDLIKNWKLYTYTKDDPEAILLSGISHIDLTEPTVIASSTLGEPIIGSAAKLRTPKLTKGAKIDISKRDKGIIKITTSTWEYAQSFITQSRFEYIILKKSQKAADPGVISTVCYLINSKKGYIYTYSIGRIYSSCSEAIEEEFPKIIADPGKYFIPYDGTITTDTFTDLTKFYDLLGIQPEVPTLVTGQAIKSITGKATAIETECQQKLGENYQYITNAANEFNIPVGFICAVIKAVNPTFELNPKTEGGIMQFSQIANEDLPIDHRLTLYIQSGQDDRLDPSKSIPAGVEYLSIIREKYLSIERSNIEDKTLALMALGYSSPAAAQDCKASENYETCLSGFAKQVMAYYKGEQQGITDASTTETTEEAEEKKWFDAFNAIITPVEIDGNTIQISYDKFIEYTLSPELTAQALFQKGEFFMKVAERLFNMRGGVILISTTGLAETPVSASEFSPTIDYKQDLLTLTLDSSKYYKIIIFSESNFITFNSVKDKTYFKEGRFSVKLSDEDIDSRGITHVTVQVYDGVINLDEDVYTSAIVIQKEDFTIVTEGKPATTPTTSQGQSQYSAPSNCNQYWDLIEKYSTQYGVDPYLVLALIIQESNCKNLGCNLLGYCGLMQIPKSTLGWDDPEKNIETGIKILKGKYDENKNGKYFEGCSNRHIFYTEWEAAVRGYNGWGCNKDYPQQDNFVEEVMKRFNQLKGTTISEEPTEGPSSQISLSSEDVIIQLDPVPYEGKKYYYVAFNPNAINLKVHSYGKTFLGDINKFGVKTVNEFYNKLIENGEIPILVINGGFYARTNKPLGIFIEESTVLSPINSGLVEKDKSSSREYYKNGVLFVESEEILILSNEDYKTNFPNNEGVTQAIQGHLLFDKSKNYYNMNYPGLKDGQTYFAARTTVGVNCLDDTKLVFAQTAKDITEAFQIGKFLRDELKCSKAINLDGGASTSMKFKFGEIIYLRVGRSIGNIVAIYPKKGVSLVLQDLVLQESQTTTSITKYTKCEDCKKYGATDRCTQDECENVIANVLGIKCKWQYGFFQNSCTESKEVETSTNQPAKSDLYSKIKPIGIPTGLTFIDPKDFDNQVVCVPDSRGELNVCAKAFGFYNQEGDVIKPCLIKSSAINGIVKARQEVKKELGEDYEILIMSSYRTEDYQRCLRTRNKCTTRSTCGTVTGSCPKGWDDFKENQIEELISYINSMKNKIKVSTCPHVNSRAIDLCVYNKKTDALNPIKDREPFYWNDNWRDCINPDIGGDKYHACSCRNAGAITKYLLGTGSKPSSLKNVPQSDLDQMIKEVKALRKAMVRSGWATTADPNYEWWHYNWNK